MRDQTRDQIAAVMLQKGTPKQQVEALEYAMGRMKPVSERASNMVDALNRDNERLRTQVRGAVILRNAPDRLQWNPDGYWLDGEFVDNIEAAFEAAGRHK